MVLLFWSEYLNDMSILRLYVSKPTLRGASSKDLESLKVNFRCLSYRKKKFCIEPTLLYKFYWFKDVLASLRSLQSRSRRATTKRRHPVCWPLEVIPQYRAAHPILRTKHGIVFQSMDEVNRYPGLLFLNEYGDLYFLWHKFGVKIIPFRFK